VAGGVVGVGVTGGVVGVGVTGGVVGVGVAGGVVGVGVAGCARYEEGEAFVFETLAMILIPEKRMST
jgi:hypothetical protein